MKKLLPLSIASVIATNSFAGQNLGVSYSSIDMALLDLKPSMMNLHLESDNHKNIRAEGRFSLGLTDDESFYNGAHISAEIDHVVSVHFKLSPDFDATVAPYLSIGYAHVEATATADVGYNWTEVTESVSDSIIGVGLRMKLDERASGFVEIGKFDDSDVVSFGMFFPI